MDALMHERKHLLLSGIAVEIRPQLIGLQGALIAVVASMPKSCSGIFGVPAGYWPIEADAKLLKNCDFVW